MTDLAKLVVRLEAQTGQYQAQLERANKSLARFAGQQNALLGKIAGVVAGISFANLIKGAIDSADRLNDLTKQTGIAAESLSALQYAATQSGTDADGLNTALTKLAKTANEAASGGKEAAEAFRQIGVQVSNGNGGIKETDQLLLELAEQFSQYEDGAAKAALAQKIFGKSGAELIPFLNEGRAGIEALTKKAQALGIVISGEAAKAADDFNDSIATLKAQTTGFITSAIAPLLPQLTAMAEAFTSSASGARDLDGATKVLQIGVKILADAGLSLVHTFNAVGRDFGAIGAAAVAAAKLDFAAVKSIFAERNADIEEENARFQAALDALWADGTQAILEEVVVRAQKIKKQLKVEAGGIADTLSEVFVQTQRLKVGTDPMAEYYARLEEESRTSYQQQTADALQSYYRITTALDELGKKGLLTPEQIAERFNAANDEILGYVQVSAQKIKQTTVELNEFQKQAQRNTVDIIADTINAAFDGTLSEIPKKFANMLLQLAIQAQAAKLGSYLFGDGSTSGAGSTGSGFLGTIGSYLTGFFGGKRAGFGAVTPGVPYRVNENTPRSEVFVPAVHGSIQPSGSMGGLVVNNHFQITTPDGRISGATQAQIGAQAARSIQNANRRNN